MQIKALLLSVAVAGALNVPLAAAERPGVPAGWSAAGQVGKQFEVGYDEQEGAVYLRSLGEPGEQLGGLTQTIDAKPYLRQTLMLSAEVKTEDPKVRAELFMRTVGAKPGAQGGGVGEFRRRLECRQGMDRNQGAGGRHGGRADPLAGFWAGAVPQGQIEPHFLFNTLANVQHLQLWVWGQNWWSPSPISSCSSRCSVGACRLARYG